MSDVLRSLALPVLPLAILVGLAPLFSGLIAWLRARFAARLGPSPLAPYHEMLKLLAKEELRSSRPSWLTDTLPPLALGATLLAAGMVPAPGAVSAPGATGGPLALVGLLALARLARTLSALESRCPVAATATARETILASLLEPTLLLALLARAVACGSAELGDIAAHALRRDPVALSSHVLALSALALALVVETARAQVTGPGALQAAALREHTGAPLAMLQLAAHIRHLLLWTLFVSLMIPGGTSDLPALAPFGLAVKLLGVAVLLAWAQVAFARLGLGSLPGLGAAALVLAVLALVSALGIPGGRV